MVWAPRWLVQVGSCSRDAAEELLLEALSWDCAALLLPNHLHHYAACAAELERLSAPKLWLSPVLLGAAEGDCCWYRYNDKRFNGTQGPEALEAGRPNLRLEHLELKPLLPLSRVVEAWRGQNPELAALVAAGGGWLRLAAADPEPLLAGAAPLLPLLAAVQIRAPLDAPGSSTLSEAPQALLAAAGLVREPLMEAGWRCWRRPAAVRAAEEQVCAAA